MLKKELCSICKFYAVSPIHAGSGAATSAVDLPIQRERHTNWPHIQATGVKGAFRAHYREFNQNDRQLINFIFGSDTQDDWDKNDDNLPGAMSVSDAKLVAFPMRSNIAPFVWVTCPSVLKRLNADFEYAGLPGIEEIRDVKKENAVSIGSEKLDGKIILEDAVVNISSDSAESVFQSTFPELERTVLISDEMYDYAVSSCTEVQTQIKIDSKTGAAEDGGLRYQEFLPADSVLYAVVHYSRRDQAELGKKCDNQTLIDLVKGLHADTVKRHVEDVITGFIQIGGDETLGKGICRLSWIKGGAA